MHNFQNYQFINSRVVARRTNRSVAILLSHNLNSIINFCVNAPFYFFLFFHTTTTKEKKLKMSKRISMCDGGRSKITITIERTMRSIHN